MKKLLTLFGIMICLSSSAQNDSCGSATPYPTTIPHCFFFPYQQQATYCVEFTALQDTLYSDFSFVASCTQIDRTYFLYDSACNFISSNQDGKFYTPTGQQFIICCVLNCLSGLGINGICLTTALPVTFLYTYLDGTFLNWATASEVNADYFDIEGSDDLNFQSIGHIKAAGNSTSTHYYKFNCTPYTYYRVTAVDYNGYRTYSNVVSRTEDYQEYKMFTLQGVEITSPQGIYIIQRNGKFYLETK